jgi:hypothetical protein
MHLFRILLCLASCSLVSLSQTRIPDLPSITGSAVDPANDLLWLNDTSAGNNSGASKKITLAELVNVSSFTNGNFLAANSIEIAQVNGLAAALESTDISNASVNAAIEEDPAATIDSLALDPLAISDALNWQPNVMARTTNGSSGQLRLMTMGDSLSTGIRLAPSMSSSGGLIGNNPSSGQVSVTEVSNWGDYWMAPILQVAASGTYPFTVGGIGQTPVDFPADRLILIYVRESGAGTFDLQTSSNAGSSWTTQQNINAAGALAAIPVTVTLSTTNFAHYRARVTNVTGGPVKIIAMGLYKSSGQGVITLSGLANLSGLDLVNFGKVPAAIFDPAWTALAPDLVISNFADAPEDWQETKLALTSGSTNNGSTSISFAAYPARSYSPSFPFRPFPQVGDTITGSGIPAGTRITAHTEGTTVATISQAATATATSSVQFTIMGAFVSFYDRCKAAYAATDFVQVSMNPLLDSSSLSGTYSAWQSGVSYAVNDRVVKLSEEAPNAGIHADPPYVQRCIQAHTSGSTTNPKNGVSRASYWENDSFNPASIAAGNTRASLQAAAQKAWALRDNESFINGFSMYRGYQEGVTAGLLSGDSIHPSANGHEFKNNRVWNSIPVSRMIWGGGGRVPGGNSEVYSLLASGDPSLSPLMFPRGLHIRKASDGGLTIWDRTSPTSQASASNMYTDGGFFLQTNGSSTAMVAGISSFTGIHPGSNGSTLGGRGSFWWNVGGAGLRLEYAEKTANYTLTAADHTINVTANSITLTLPDSVTLNSSVSNYTNAAAGAMGKIYVMKNSGVGTVTLATTNSELINGSSPGTLTTGQSIQVQSTGTGWITIP